ncbi:hypothetical protein LNAOJCKE_0921 [Methylorubrum aminovorans]|uniref:Uncharacterized protein n=1 Tax=Methylorubrum aminovorans TaxID=269069 RepID=A0ABQ4U9M3_9HYPH|nr:hypothetical protein [Methylorubrum aminovorans]GJE63723.1 hypothetical protein LNAOJCKE_0921 [Methylorubrum aminovorans]GMA73652.1 hypothetical protein GCM10025880_00690 [Methylorubrum aminovorans]GMA79838.1 hypothetical protein GCM10025880_62550 [Methylorubrum aminovorans]
MSERATQFLWWAAGHAVWVSIGGAFLANTDFVGFVIPLLINGPMIAVNLNWFADEMGWPA